MTFKGELIGTHVEVIKSNNAALIGMKGKVIDETKNMIMLQNHKMIEKKNVWLKIFDGRSTLEINGNSLVGRPEDRLKKVANKNG